MEADDAAKVKAGRERGGVRCSHPLQGARVHNKGHTTIKKGDGNSEGSDDNDN